MNKLIKTLRRNIIPCSLLALSCLLPNFASAAQPLNLKNNSQLSLAPMLKEATPAVVNITVEKTTPENPNADLQDQLKDALNRMAVGSGVIVDATKGYIVTNEHIIKNQKIMVVTLKDGRRYRAKLVGSAPGYDIAVIQIKAKHLTAMPIGNSGSLNVGDFVVAVGSPFGLSQTVTSGVVSALNRTTPKIEGFQNFIQTDAPINPGNSGGALIDTSGNLVGMNTAIISPAAGNIGIGFAIPSNMVKTVADQLIKYKKVKPGLLGVIAQNLTLELAEAMGLKETKGVLVTQVMPSSPAEAAGLKSEDIILEVDQDPVMSAAQLHNLMGITHPGTKIKLHILHKGKPETLTAKVADPKAKMKQRYIPYLSGLRLQDFSDLEPNSTMIKGTMVLSVSDSSAGALAGVLPGDVIISANGHSVNSVRDLITVATHSPQQLLLKIVRGATNIFLVIQPDQ